MPYFADITVDKNGIVTVVERRTCKIYQYDQEGNLITVFGGKSTNQKGLFSSPSSITADEEGKIYVLDRDLNNIQVFKPTRFIQLVHEALSLYSEGEYDQAYEVWQGVLKIDENFQLARAGMGHSLFKQRRWHDAMEQYTLADDRGGYSEAFVKYRHEIFRKYFPLVVLGLILLIGALYYLVKYMKIFAGIGIREFEESNSERMNTLHMIRFSFSILFHPIRTFDHIKNCRDRLNYIPSIIILLMLVIVRIYYIYTVHYPLADVDPMDANIWLEITKLLLPILTWILATFMTTSILGGESKPGEIFVVSSFCILPYVLFTILLPPLSHILTREESGLYFFISNLS